MSSLIAVTEVGLDVSNCCNSSVNYEAAIARQRGQWCQGSAEIQIHKQCSVSIVRSSVDVVESR